jgi:HD-GYP domain-containing protein (c-di-GMP phosphodiesterase class II)
MGVAASLDLKPLEAVGDLLAAGQALPFRIVDEHGRLLLAAGHVVDDERQLNALLERGAFVAVHEADAVRKAYDEAAGVAEAPDQLAPKPSWFARFERQIWSLDELLRTAGRDPALAPRLEAFGDELIALAGQQPDAALFMAVRQDDRRFALYGLTHALHVATVVQLTARQIGWPGDRLRRAVLAALTMNAAITELQAKMAEQSGPPTRRQLELIRAHPQRSAEMLRASGVVDAEWLAAVEDHHERVGAAGYPRGLTEIGEIACVLRACDVFTAKISPRALRTAMPPQRAARELFQEERGGPVAAALIKAVGVYPAGDFVRLKNGETAIVVRRAADGHAPQVTTVLGANGKLAAGAPRRDTADPEYAIVSAAADASGLPRVLPEQVYGLLDS